MVYKNNFKKFFYLCIVFNTIAIFADVTRKLDHHVIFSLKKSPKNKSESKEYNKQIYQATQEIINICKKQQKLFKANKNEQYHHKEDSVFFVHFDHNFNNWTLYKPSDISHNSFVKLAIKIYRQHGLLVDCCDDAIVKIANDPNLSNKYISLDNFEKYSKMPQEDFNNLLKTSNDELAQDLELINQMKHKFFWHWQIPTVGLIKRDASYIDKQYGPIAWNFLLWDLAPEKGKGARVAIIDTGISAFNIKNNETLSQVYKKNINITAPYHDYIYGYNLVGEHGLDPIRQLAIEFGHHCDQTLFQSDDLILELPSWIIELIESNNSFQIEQFFTKNAKKEYLEQSSNSLNEKGKEVLKDLLYGKYGIIPTGNVSKFNIAKLDYPYNSKVILETLPAPKITGDSQSFAAGHGTFTNGIVGAQLYEEKGISGIAPHAHVTMIKAFHDSGTTNKTTLNAALQKALYLKNSIVSLSLKITDTFDKTSDAHLKELIDSIDYVVAASGNDGKTLSKQAYPAKFDSVAFDVGAFTLENDSYDICPFTQKELSIGPKIVAPGFDIFGAGLTPDQESDSMYVLMSGTSIAVPIITGFMALVLGEFQNDFSREQILKVVYKFSIKLKDDETWQKYIKVGTPDMRSALFCFHILRAIEKKIIKEQLDYKFDKHFDNLVQAIYTINYYTPSLYEKKIGYSCTNNFQQYFLQVQEKKPLLDPMPFFDEIKNNLDNAINYIADMIIMVIKKESDESYKKNINYKNLMKLLDTDIYSKKLNLFLNSSSSALNRIKKVLIPKKSCLLTE